MTVLRQGARFGGVIPALHNAYHLSASAAVGECSLTRVAEHKLARGRDAALDRGCGYSPANLRAVEITHEHRE